MKIKHLLDDEFVVGGENFKSRPRDILDCYLEIKSQSNTMKITKFFVNKDSPDLYNVEKDGEVIYNGYLNNCKAYIAATNDNLI